MSWFYAACVKRESLGADWLQRVHSVCSDWLSAAAKLELRKRNTSVAGRRVLKQVFPYTNTVYEALCVINSMDDVRRMCVPLLAVLIGAVNAFSPTDSEFTFLLPAASKECFYQSAIHNGSIEIEYQV